MIKRLAINLLVHFAFVVCYPYLGPHGLLYAALSFTLWSLFIMLGGLVLNMLRFLLGPLKFLENILLFAVIGLALAYVMPQADGVRVITKLKNRQLPTGKDIKHGLTAFGLDRAGKRTAEAVTAETRKAVNALDKRAAPVAAIAAEKIAKAAKKVEKKADEISEKAKKSAKQATADEPASSGGK
ncbi:MAG: hypothetical protein PHW69_03315 [Elusimicrobiaceae bacterium]|nr:hypothetical protein [Elusimicrobiaceae bacterium]